jgi:3-keto-disaccharide hydrolase
MIRILALLSFVPALFAADNSFVGRWDFNIDASGRSGAAWLGVLEKNGQVEVWYQNTTGNVSRVNSFKLEGAHLSVPIGPATTWELDAVGGKLSGFEKRGDRSIPLTGMRAPELKRAEPKSWTTPEPLFNGKDLAGWEPIGDIANNHWVVQDGLLVNEAHGANLKTTRQFDDFKVHYEVNCPDGGNSGFYLRGRYEVQIEYEPLSKNPPERRIGSIYGRLAPSPDLPRKPGEWESFDVTLTGRIVTVAHNGMIVIDHKEIEGITGGALDANEGQPGSFYIQGDHTGGLKFRNITVSVPKR